ncbi:L-shaped tail fiber protein [Kononvirus KKP3711]|uniref:L-shaped tail fiber protein n=1 Tax=Enterobacter phage KKP_3711 TaxID=3109398 RepID=A0AAX4Q431_9CAUD
MSIENKMVDLSVEANIPYGLLMQFEDVETLLDSENIVPINLTGSTFKGAIKASLDPGAALLETFTITVVDAASGVVAVSLSKTQTANLTTKASKIRDKYNPRLRFVGYYDIIMTKTSSNTNFRVLEGKVYISDGVTT